VLKLKKNNAGAKRLITTKLGEKNWREEISFKTNVEMGRYYSNGL
jgi:hypothetical protein